METKKQKFNRLHPGYDTNLSREARRKTRLLVLDLLGNKCVKCGFKDIRALQVDHIKGGGLKETKNDPNYRANLLKHLQAGNTKFQLLCANCNFIKRYENNDLPYANRK